MTVRKKWSVYGTGECFLCLLSPKGGPKIGLSLLCLFFFHNRFESKMEEDNDFAGDMFADPEGYYQEPPPPSKHTYPLPNRKNEEDPERKVEVSLVGEHPLWAHHLWNAGVVLADMACQRPTQMDDRNDHAGRSLCTSSSTSSTQIDVEGKRVLELGAGGALPSMSSVYFGARSVVISEYPDQDLIDNIKSNIHNNLSTNFFSSTSPSSPHPPTEACGHIWGQDCSPLLLSALPPSQQQPQKFDIIFLADLVFNHSQHHALLRTCRGVLAEGGEIYVSFSHHKPENEEKDLEFLRLAAKGGNGGEGEGYGFEVRKLFQTRREPMFPEDPGSVLMRSTVHVYHLS